MELSIDSSTQYASVGLSSQGKINTEISWHSQKNHSVELVPAIRELLSRHTVPFKNLKAIFVAGGPGGFSALRVGMSTAKALSMGLDIPIISISTLDIEAQSYLDLNHCLIAVIPAGRKQVYFGKYVEQTNPEYKVVPLQQLTSNVPAGALVCGEAVNNLTNIRQEFLEKDIKVISSPPPTRRSSVLAKLGYRRWQAGELDDPSTLQPIYLRSSQVNTANRSLMKKSTD